MRSISSPFVVARPSGTQVRTRLRLSAADQAVVGAVGEYLGRLAGADLARRCRLGRDGEQRTVRKRSLTGRSSSRWAGSITRTSNEQWQRGMANLADRRIALRRASSAIRSRLAVPVGQRQGRVRGYASRAERFAKQGRLQRLQAELTEVEGRLTAGRVSVCRGGRRFAKQRHTLDQAKLTERQWRARWQAERLFLTADGDAAYPLGNGTIVVHPEERWCEIKLPSPLVHLPTGRVAATGWPARWSYPPRRGVGRAGRHWGGALRHRVLPDEAAAVSPRKLAAARCHPTQPGAAAT
jgi:hypothetical protein